MTVSLGYCSVAIQLLYSGRLPWFLLCAVLTCQKETSGPFTSTRLHLNPTELGYLLLINSGFSLLITIIHPSPIGQAPTPSITIMPAQRASTAIRPQTPAPYKIPVIVISSDEEDEPRPAPKRSSRKPRRSKPDDFLEILEEKPQKHDQREGESLHRRCHELEQVYMCCM